VSFNGKQKIAKYLISALRTLLVMSAVDSNFDADAKIVDAPGQQ
jgi:hypothetical protein